MAIPLLKQAQDRRKAVTGRASTIKVVKAFGKAGLVVVGVGYGAHKVLGRFDGARS